MFWRRLNGGWQCDQPATAALGDRRRGGDWAVCDAHSVDPPEDLRWAGCYAEWDADRDCWKLTGGAALTRPAPWEQ